LVSVEDVLSNGGELLAQDLEAAFAEEEAGQLVDAITFNTATDEHVVDAITFDTVTDERQVVSGVNARFTDNARCYHGGNVRLARAQVARSTTDRGYDQRPSEGGETR
jgi:hypothetical protein